MRLLLVTITAVLQMVEPVMVHMSTPRSRLQQVLILLLMWMVAGETLLEYMIGPITHYIILHYLYHLPVAHTNTLFLVLVYPAQTKTYLHITHSPSLCVFHKDISSLISRLFHLLQSLKYVVDERLLGSDCSFQFRDACLIRLLLPINFLESGGGDGVYRIVVQNM